MKKNRVLYLLLGLTAIGITAANVIFHQDPLRSLPLYLSLFVNLLNARVNRYGLLVGALNSLLYGAVYVYYKMYASAISAVAVSFTFQLVSFLLWSRRPYGTATIFRRLNLKQRLLAAGAFVVAWSAILLILSRTDASYAPYDTTATLIGLAASLLMLFSFAEYACMTVLSNLFALVLYIRMMSDHPEMLSFLVYSVYGTVCSLFSLKKVSALYKQQQEEGK